MSHRLAFDQTLREMKMFVMIVSVVTVISSGHLGRIMKEWCLELLTQAHLKVI